MKLPWDCHERLKYWSDNRLGLASLVLERAQANKSIKENESIEEIDNKIAIFIAGYLKKHKDEWNEGDMAALRKLKKKLVCRSVRNVVNQAIKNIIKNNRSQVADAPKDFVSDSHLYRKIFKFSKELYALHVRGSDKDVFYTQLEAFLMAASMREKTLFFIISGYVAGSPITTLSELERDVK